MGRNVLPSFVLYSTLIPMLTLHGHHIELADDDSSIQRYGSHIILVTEIFPLKKCHCIRAIVSISETYGCLAWLHVRLQLEY